MTEIKHTPEPWHIFENEYFFEIHGSESGEIGNTCASNYAGMDNSKPNARRIVLCVNACADISNESLERGWGLDRACKWDMIEARRSRDIAIEQRDELLAALKHHQELTRPIQRSIDIIAKCEANHG